MTTKLPWKRTGTGASVPGTNLRVWRDQRTKRYSWGIMDRVFYDVSTTRDGAILAAEERLERLPASLLRE
jgi:hypothetical protein